MWRNFNGWKKKVSVTFFVKKIKIRRYLDYFGSNSQNLPSLTIGMRNFRNEERNKKEEEWEEETEIKSNEK